MGTGRDAMRAGDFWAGMVGAALFGGAGLAVYLVERGTRLLWRWLWTQKTKPTDQIADDQTREETNGPQEV